MDDNIYSAPKADLGTTATGTAPTRYYVVSARKFLIMSIATFGYYTPYWFYRNWREINNSDGGKRWPIMRGLFSLFFVHQLAAILHRAQPARLYLHATAFVGFQLTSYIAAASGRVPGGISIDLLLILMTVAVAAILLPFQKAINAASGEPEGAANDRLTGANWFWIALGLIWWALSVNVMLFPEHAH